MFRAMQVMTLLFCSISYAAAGTLSIGTASARGNIRVDNYLVKNNTTLFDGSVVETGQATADLRLDNGTQITMGANSLATLFKDHIVLQRGKSELATPTSFEFEVNGLHVITSEPNSRGVVTLGTGNTVEVAALNGSFGVSNDHGVLLARVQPGAPISFAVQAGENATTVTDLPGMLSFEDGHYYLTSSNYVKYELINKSLKRYIGTKVVISGTIQGSGALGQQAIPVVALKSIELNGGEMRASAKVVIGGVVVAATGGIAYWIYDANQTSTRDSR